MTVVTMPDGVPVDFGNMPPAEIKALIQKKFPDFGKAPAASAPAAPEYGSLFDPIMQGVTFGTFDELVGGIGGIGGVLSGEGWNKGYDTSAGIARENLEAYRQRNPIASTVGELGGAVSTLPVTGALNLIRAPATAGRLAQVGATTGNAAITGAAYGAGYGAGTGEGGLGPRIKSALEGATVGGVLGAAAPAVVSGIKRVGGALLGHPIKAYQHITKPGAAADRLVTDAIKKDAAARGISPDEAIREITTAQQQGLPRTALDVGEATRGLARSARNTSPEAHDILASQTGERVATQYDRLADFLSRPGIAPGTNAPQKLKIIQAAAEQTNKARYKKAYSQGSFGIWNDDLANLTGSKDVQRAIRNAQDRMTSEGAMRGGGQVPKPFKAGPDGTLVPVEGVTPTLEFWDQVQRSLRDMGKRQSGERMAENAALYDRLRSNLNSILDREVPAFNEARLGAFKFFQAEDALEAGVKFANMRGDVLKSGAARDAINAMTPAERALFAEGYASEFLNKAAKIPIDHTMVKRIFGDRVTREQFELALGPAATREMETRMHIEGILDKGRAAIAGNSTTAAQLIAQQTALAGGRAVIGGIGGAVLSGDPMSAGTLLGAILTAGIGKRAGAIMSRADEQMMRRVAEMLASDDPAVVKEAIRRVSNNPRMMDAVRSGHAWATRALVPLAAKNAEAEIGGEQPQGYQ